jgi:hypothetical protein
LLWLSYLLRHHRLRWLWRLRQRDRLHGRGSHLRLIPRIGLLLRLLRVALLRLLRVALLRLLRVALLRVALLRVALLRLLRVALLRVALLRLLLGHLLCLSALLDDLAW